MSTDSGVEIGSLWDWERGRKTGADTSNISGVKRILSTWSQLRDKQICQSCGCVCGAVYSQTLIESVRAVVVFLCHRVFEKDEKPKSYLIEKDARCEVCIMLKSLEILFFRVLKFQTLWRLPIISPSTMQEIATNTDKVVLAWIEKTLLHIISSESSISSVL